MSVCFQDDCQLTSSLSPSPASRRRSERSDATTTDSPKTRHRSDAKTTDSPSTRRRADAKIINSPSVKRRSEKQDCKGDKSEGEGSGEVKVPPRVPFLTSHRKRDRGKAKSLPVEIKYAKPKWSRGCKIVRFNLVDVCCTLRGDRVGYEVQANNRTLVFCAFKV